jgi:hypothetical protein
VNSSTSSSDRWRRRRSAWFILAILVLLFVGLELIARAVLIPQSKDYARFCEYPARAQHLAGESGLRVALLGNSATDRGVDPVLLAGQMSDLSGRSVYVEKFVADRAGVNTWYYMAKHYFWRHGRSPDWIVVNFFDSSLQDRPPMDVGRLAYFFTESEDWPELCDVDLSTTADRADFLLSKYWFTYAARDRIKDRILAGLAPGYKEVAGELNASQFRGGKSGSVMGAASYRALGRFLGAARNRNTKVCFVSFPPRLSDGPPYDIDDNAVRVIHDFGMEFIDLRRVPELRPEFYADRIHLSNSTVALS